MSTPTLFDFQQLLDIQAKPTCDRSNDNERSSSTKDTAQHKRHPNSNPLLVLSVLRRTLSTNALSTHTLPLTKIFKRTRLKICYNCLTNSLLKTDNPSKMRCQEPNCGASHHTSLRTQLRKAIRNVNKQNPSTDEKSVSSKLIYKLTTTIQARQRSVHPRVKTNPPDNHSLTPPPSTNFLKKSAGEFGHSSRSNSTAAKHLFSPLPMNHHHNQLPPTFWNITGMMKK